MHIVTGNGDVDKKALLLLFLAALMAAVGILALGATCLNIDLAAVEAIHIVGIIAGLTGGIFGGFLLSGFRQQRY